MANLFYMPFRPAYDSAGVSIPGAKAYFTVDPGNVAADVYSDEALTTVRSNPVIANGVGKFPTTYLDPAVTYRVRIYGRNATVSVDTPLEEFSPYVPGMLAEEGIFEDTVAAIEESAEAAADSAAAAIDAMNAIIAAQAGEDIGVYAIPTFTPEMFGATGGDADVDGPALEAMAGALSAAGRGVINFYPGREYLVGNQTLNGSTPFGTFRYAPDIPYIVEIDTCDGPVVINGNGAKIKCIDNARYGTFNADGSDYAPVLPFNDPTYAATPYFSMLYIHDCSGSVKVASGLELDGNIGAANIGGGYGDAGTQMGMSGVVVENNTGPVDVSGVYAHHHGLDGAIVDGPGELDVIEGGSFNNCQFLNNGRQGLSWVGGNGWTFNNCLFNETGRDIGDLTASLPGAGVDIEPEGGKYCINGTFNNCQYTDCAGVGFLIPTGTTNAFNITCNDCVAIGTTTFSLWPNARYFRWNGGLIMGAIIYLKSSATNPQEAAQIKGARLVWNLAWSPTGTLYGYGATRGFDPTGSSENVLWDDCSFEDYAADDTEAQSKAFDFRGHFRNCYFSAAIAGGYGSHQGTTEGPRTTFNQHWAGIPSAAVVAVVGGATAYSGPSLDSFVFNGTRYQADTDRATYKKLYYGSATVDPASLAAGAKTTIATMTITGAALGDRVEDTSFSLDLAGARIHAWVSAANTVSYYFVNENGANPLDLASGTLRVKVRQA